MNLIDAIRTVARIPSDVDSKEFNVALAQLQGIIGQKNGDLAGAFFSGDIGDNWCTYSFEERIKYLKQYVSYELDHFGIS